MSKRLSFPLILTRFVLFFVVALPFLWWNRNKPAAEYDRVIKVYDGDTIKIQNGKHIRLLGIDTPELNQSDKLARDAKRAGVSPRWIQSRGLLASQFTNKLAAGKPVRLEFDIERQDRYGRLLAYVFIPVCEWQEGEPPCQTAQNQNYEYRELPGITKDHAIYIFLNATILKAGYAEPMTIRPNTQYANDFKKLYEAAKEARRGLWTEGDK